MLDVNSLIALIKEKKYRLKPLAIIAAVLLLDFIFLFRAQVVFLTKTVSHVSKLKKEISNTKKGAGISVGLLKPADKLKSDMFLQEKKIVLEQEIPLFLSEVAQIAKEANVKLVQIRPQRLGKEVSKDSQGRMYFNLPIELDLTCGYHALGVFINKLERAEKYTKVSRYEISSKDEAPFDYPVKMALEILVVR